MVLSNKSKLVEFQAQNRPFAFDGDHGKMVLSNKSRLVEFQAQNRAFAFVGDHGKMVLKVVIL